MEMLPKLSLVCSLKPSNNAIFLFLNSAYYTKSSIAVRHRASSSEIVSIYQELTWASNNNRAIAVLALRTQVLFHLPERQLSMPVQTHIHSYALTRN